MSAFLGPIHDKMFARVTFLETIERYIYNEGMLKFGDSINEIRIAGEELYGGSTLGYQIEEVVDTTNIHGSLQELVNNVEERHSFIIGKIMDKYLDKGKELLNNVYEKIGGLLANKYTDAKDDSHQIYDFLSHYFLDGMPCNSISGILEDNETELSWIFANSLHQSNFHDCDVEIYYNLRKELVNVFLEQIGSRLTYGYDIKTIDSNELYIQSLNA